MCVLVSANREFKSCLRDDRRERFLSFFLLLSLFSGSSARDFPGTDDTRKRDVASRSERERKSRVTRDTCITHATERVGRLRGSAKVIGATRAWMTRRVVVDDENPNDERRGENERESVYPGHARVS